MQKHLTLPDWLFKYTAAAILIVVPLFPKFPFIRVPGTFVSIRLEDTIISFAALLCLLLLASKLKSVLNDRFVKVILLFISIGAISLISAVFITQTVSVHIAFLHWARRIEYFVPIFLGWEVIKRRKSDLQFYIKIMICVVFCIFIYGFGQRYFQWPIIITQNEEYSKGVALRWVEGSHINSTFAGHYDLATFLVLLLPLVVALLFTLRGRITKSVMFLTYIAGMWLLASSASRVSILSFLSASLFSLLALKKGKAIVFVVISVIIFSGMSSNLLARYKRLIEVTFEKTKITGIYNIPVGIVHAEEKFDIRKVNPSPSPTPIPVFEDRSTNIRLKVEWPRALRALLKNPLLGTGYSSITLATDNDFLRLLGEIGILGFGSFILVLFQVVLNLSMAFWHKYPVFEKTFIICLFGSLFGVLLNALFIDVFEASKFALIFWLFIGFGLGLVKNNNYEQ